MYVLLKLPFVNEKVAIDDSVSTIKWTFKQGANVVSLELVSVQDSTIVLLKNDNY